MLPSLLLLLLSSGLVSSSCPSDCTCTESYSTIFCIHRRSTTVPLVPVTTKELFIFQNGIQTLTEDDFSGLLELELLDISQNGLKEIPDWVFGRLSKLKNLDLSTNHITHIDKHSFSGLVRLERLYLHANRIQTIHFEAFEGLERLLELKLYGNQLSSLPALQLPKLLLLDLSKNNIPTLGPADIQAPHLESLKLASLGLTTLDKDLIASFKNLHDLDISMNQLTEVPQALKQDSLKGLIKLNLSANPFGELITKDFEKLIRLQELDISGLHLQGFPPNFLQIFPKLTHLTAAENPFNCLCPLAWFPVWLKEKDADLLRPEETRCHFPLVNAGKMLSSLEPNDFGCPPVTTVLTESLTGSTPVPQMFTTPLEKPDTNAILPPPPPPPSEVTGSTKVDSLSYSPEPTDSPSANSREDLPIFCPPNICLNGGTCNFDPQGQLSCLCPSSTSGHYCENMEEIPEPTKPMATEVSVIAPVMSADLDAISSRQVTSTSISLDLHRFIETRPHIKGIRLTYRNLSGPDRRPIILSVPASYPEYTLRGLRPNSTYSVCASPFGERISTRTNSSAETGSCTEARTESVPMTPEEPKAVAPSKMPNSLIPALAAMALVGMLAAVAVMLICLRRRRQAKAGLQLELGPADPMELDGIKACLENGGNGTLQQKQSEIDCCHTSQPSPSLQQNGGLDYDVPLMQEHCPSNNNLSLKPSYF